MSYFLHEQIYRTAPAMERLRALNVTICGAGALGANIAENLARSGYGRLKIIDFDRIEEHNLSTQPYERSDIGAYKSQIMINHLYRAVGVSAEPITRELTAENGRKLLKGSDLVVDTFDNSTGRAAVKDTCTHLAIPCLHAGLATDYAEVIWNDLYRVPSDVGAPVCDYPLARNLVILTVAVACEVLTAFALKNVQESFTITLADFSVQPFQP